MGACCGDATGEVVDARDAREGHEYGEDDPEGESDGSNDGEDDGDDGGEEGSGEENEDGEKGARVVSSEHSLSCTLSASVLSP